MVETAERPRQDVEAGHARWTRLAVVGLAFVAAGPLLMLGAGLVWGLDLSEFVLFLLITSVVPLIGAFLVWRFGMWAKVVGILTALVPATMLFWTAFGLAYPASFFDFMPGVLVIPGALLATVSCISAIVAGRRGHASATAVGGEAKALRIALGAVLVLAVVSGGLTLADRSTVDAAAADTIVDMKDFEFDQDSYTFAAGTTVLIRNSDPFLHTFTVDELDIDVILGPGSEELVEVPARPGTYVLFCRPHTFDPENPDDEAMAAEMTIE